MIRPLAISLSILAALAGGAAAQAPASTPSDPPASVATNPSSAAQSADPATAPADDPSAVSTSAAPPSADAPSTDAPSTGASSAVAQTADTGRVAVPAPSEKAVRYHRGNVFWWVVGTIWGLLVPAVILFTGFSARLRDASKRVGRNWFFTLAVYVALFTLITWVAGLPLAYYTGFAREHAFGLSNQSFGAWIGDSLKALALGMIFAPLILWVPYLLIRKSPRRWWLYTSAAAVPFLVFVVWASPVFLEPIFDKFGPMQDKRLEARILALADRAGIEGSRVYEVAKSEDTNAVNAYVNGFGSSKRIVLWDTLLEKLGEREVLFVMGHEMGHYVLRHVVRNIVVGVLLILLSLWSVHRASRWLIDKYRHRFGFTELGDIASYPLLGLVIGIVALVVTPLVNVNSRWQEHEADRFGLELTRDNRNAATAFVKLQQENLAVPYPGLLYELWLSSHPSLGERVEFANEYRPWETGGELKYGERFEGR